MCGILGIFNSKESFSKTVTALSIMKERGMDGVGICAGSDCQYVKGTDALHEIKSVNILGHNLHSVVSHVRQPIKKKGILTANCEIYNWKELKEKYGLQSNNDSDLLIDLIEKKGSSRLKETVLELDGDYAFGYFDDKSGKVYLARDIMGVKPIWYCTDGFFAFASEKKALLAIGAKKVEELNPRVILKYDLRTQKLTRIKRTFFEFRKDGSNGVSLKQQKDIRTKTQELLFRAVEKRLPDGKFGLLFSGGLDSSVLAKICQKLGRKDFICYTAALDEPGMEEAQDLVQAKLAAAELGLDLKVKKISLSETRKYLEKIPGLIEDSNVVKVGVALTFHIACELAKQDKIRVILSGLGSEEIFAGYDRHKKSIDVNKECYSGLLKIYERDLYRDDVITMHNNLELRVPFLDKELAEYSLQIPASMKLDDTRNKILLREIAKDLGISKNIAERPKKAAQYGSKFDRAIEKLTHKEGFRKKSEFLYQFYHPPNVKLGVLWSSGKDSAFAAWIMQKQNYELSCFISLKSKNPDSYMFHTPNISLVELQAKAAKKPIIIQETAGEKEAELNDLEKAIKRAKSEYAIEGIVTGAIFSNYQRERIEKICDKLELKIFSPLWHIDQEMEMRKLLDEGFKITLSSIAALGFDKTWLGKIITHKDVDKLVEINKKYGINIAGEGGEFESLVLWCPLFDKEIKIMDYDIVEDGKHSARMNVKKAILR